MTRLCRLGAFLLFQLIALLSFAQNSPPPVPRVAPIDPNVPHKVQVSNPLLARQIESQGGQLIADYGSFKLYQVPQLTPGMLANTRDEVRDDYDVIELNTGHLNTRTPQIQALSKPVETFPGKHLHLVQFAGPVKATWRNELLATGIRIISYVPENCYLVYGDSQSLAAVQKFATTNSYYQWHGAYMNAYKIHRLARNVDARGHSRDIGTDLFDIQMVDDPQANQQTVNLLDQLKLEPFKRQETNLNHVFIVARLNPADLAKIAAQPEIISILPYFHRQPLCERQDQIVAGNIANGIPTGPGYLTWLSNAGFTQHQFTTSGFVVDVSDSGVDNGTTSPNHFGLYTSGNTNKPSRLVYSRYESTVSYSTNSLEGCDGHGNINAHIIGGYDNLSGFPFADSAGFHFGLGVCPFVNLGSSVIFDSAESDSFYYPNLNNLQAEAYRDGARVSCNSWGATNSAGVYDSEAQRYDALVRDAQPTNSSVPVPGNQGMIIVFAAGNDGLLGSQTVDTPGTAKNVLTVGASDNVQAFGSPDHSGVGDDQATNANQIAAFSSRGPCADGRAKPDLVAPGTHVSGGVPQETNDFALYPDGIADPCYDGSGISGGPDGSIFWPTNQQFYTASSGTSQSTPCVGGGCALVYQYFINHFTNAPSPAMTKAFLMNSARYLTGQAADDTLPSPAQGMGEMNLGMAFDGAARILSDQDSDDLFTNSGEARSFTGYVKSTNEDFRVTLAWSDAPGSTFGNAWNNDLDLTVTVGGNTYKGNVFNGAYSAPGGVADGSNNVESVFLPAGVSGNFLVRVTAANINSVGVPNSNNIPCQDFALVVYNATQADRPVIAADGSALVYEGCQPTNGVIDPGETVTVDFTLQNIGAAPTANLVATLLTNSGVQCVSGPQTYGSLLPNGSPVSQPFTFTANGTCGGNITARLQLQDGDTNLGTVNFTFGLGQFVSTTTFSENFDEVTTPSLPPGWTTNVSGADSPWVTDTNEYDTSSNSVFVPDVAVAGTSQLISPSIPIVSSSAQLSFMNYYNLEAYPPDSSSPSWAFDGGVLEISIGGAPFQDILQAGGSFVSGGYVTNILDSSNPLNGRLAWSGDSHGFIQTLVNLPAAAAGQNIQLRWMLGTDSSNAYGGVGWYIDTISIMDGYYSCCSSVVPLQILTPQIIGNNIVFSFPSNCGQSYSVQSTTNVGNPAWTTFQSVTGDGSLVFITNSIAGPQKFYRIISP